MRCPRPCGRRGFLSLRAPIRGRKIPRRSVRRPPRRDLRQNVGYKAILPFEHGVRFLANRACGRDFIAASRIDFLSSGLTPVIATSQRSFRPRIALQHTHAPSSKATCAGKNRRIFFAFFKKAIHLSKCALCALIQLRLSPFLPSYIIQTHFLSYAFGEISEGPPK